MPRQLRRLLSIQTVFIVILSLGGPEARAQWMEDGWQTILERSSNTAADFFGWTAVPLGDVDDDGIIDIATSAVFSGASSGSIHAYSGATGSPLWTTSENLPSAIMGYALETMDWNDDGVLDVLAGAPFNTVSAGRVWVLDGASGDTIHTIVVGTLPGDAFGAAIATGGDFDGDGTDDVAVSDFLFDASGMDSAGRVYVFNTDGTIITTIDGPSVDAEFGIGLAYVGDTNEDGRDEIVIGRRLTGNFFAGEASVYGWNGNAPVHRYTVDGVGMGFNLIGDRIDGGLDVNGDFIGDFVVGDMNANNARVFSGADGSSLYTVNGEGQGGSFGSVRFVEDLDGDGR
ncbi:MAG: hypothetical protein ACYTGC_01250, partial [Planctomycetota bacterium]